MPSKKPPTPADPPADPPRKRPKPGPTTPKKPRKSQARPKDPDAPKKPKRPPHRVREARATANKEAAAATGQPVRKGRPLSLTESVSKAITDALKVGSYLQTAISMGGISSATFHAWIKRGHDERKRREAFELDLAAMERKTERWAMAQADEAITKQKEEPYLAFMEAVTLAVAESEVSALKTIKTASKDDWRAAAWMLERRTPTKWGRRVLDINATVDAAIVDATKVEEIAAGETVKASEGGEGTARRRLAAALEKLVGNMAGGQAATAQLRSGNGIAAEHENDPADDLGID